MPVIPPETAPSPAPAQGQPDIDKLREALIPAIMAQISGPSPTPPQYQPAPVSPLQGYAMARNPQAAGLINQTIQAPGQAQFQQQQAAFEQAMDQRKTAMTLGAGLLNTQTRAGGKGLRFIKSVIKDENGQSRVKLDVFDPMTFQYIGTGDLGEAGTPPGMTPYIEPGTGAAQIGLVDKSRGTIKPVTSGGAAVGAVPPEGAVKAATQTLNFGQQLKEAEDSFASYISNKSQAQRMGTSALLQLPFGLKGPADEFVVSYTDPEGSVTSKNLNSVADSLLRLKSGAQINEMEYQRLRTFLPKLGENPATAQQKFQTFRQELAQTLKVNMRLHPDLFTDSGLQASGFTRADLLGIAEGSTGPTIPTSAPGPPEGQVIHMSDVRAKYPNPADQQRIREKAKATGIPVVED